MRKKKHKEPELSAEEREEATQAETEESDGAVPTVEDQEDLEASGPAAEPEVAALEPADDTVRRLTEELERVNDRCLRIAAEFDNYRKRVTREQAEARTRSQADVARRLIEALDDLARVAGLEESDASVHDVVTGVHLVERKLLQELGDLGMDRVGGEGETFDPNYHEAVGAMPVGDDGEPGTIAAVLQPGYRFGQTLLRPARVLVYVTPEPAEAEELPGEV
jgi:molecular chaperone GrpE